LIGKFVRVYTLHHPAGADVLKDDPILVVEGFNWPAALLTSLWALWHGMWVIALLSALAAVGLQYGLDYLGANDAAQLAVTIGFSAVFGFCGNDWKRAKMSRRGYRLQGIIAAPDPDSARRRWFDLHPPGAPAGSGY
jgi:hypothetical protein